MSEPNPCTHTSRRGLCNDCLNRIVADAHLAGRVSGVKDEWIEISRWKPYLHFCSEWDGLLIDKGDVEFESCQCLEQEAKGEK